MNRRLRFLAGALTLTAMSASFAETVLASVCTPMDRSAAMAEMSMSAEDAGVECMLMAHEHDAPDSEWPQDHCPLSPAVGAGCSAVASLPSHALEADASAGPARRTAATSDSDLGVLLPHALFHPPRA